MSHPRGSHGALIVFEGVEGAGKSTQVRRLGDRLRPAGIRCTTVREPGGTAVGDVYFVEITSLGQRPFDTAVLRGNAEYVENAQDGVFAQGRGSLVVVSRGPKIPGLTDPAATP